METRRCGMRFSRHSEKKKKKKNTDHSQSCYESALNPRAHLSKRVRFHALLSTLLFWVGGNIATVRSITSSPAALRLSKAVAGVQNERLDFLEVLER